MSVSIRFKQKPTLKLSLFGSFYLTTCTRTCVFRWRLMSPNAEIMFFIFVHLSIDFNLIRIYFPFTKINFLCGEHSRCALWVRCNGEGTSRLLNNARNKHTHTLCCQCSTQCRSPTHSSCVAVGAFYGSECRRPPSQPTTHDGEHISHGFSSAIESLRTYSVQCCK